MKAVIIGAGSIGTRHLKNLVALGAAVSCVDTKARARKNALNNGAYLVTDNIDHALKEKPDMAFICNLSNDHIRPALKCASKGCHLFIEKPLSTTVNGVKELIAVCRRNNLTTMVGCNMRFHPAIANIKKIIEKKSVLGTILWSNIEFGYYLPLAKKDYMHHYMSDKKLSGGILFDVIHEIDYACWFFGLPDNVVCSMRKLSDLKIMTYDNADLIFYYKKGLSVNVHMDYLQRSYTRRCKIVGQKAVLEWDFQKGEVSITKGLSNKGTVRKISADIYYNKMYRDEIVYFLKHIKSGKKTFNDINHSFKVLKVVNACVSSSDDNKWRKIK